jgi:hypothetical protein
MDPYISTLYEIVTAGLNTNSYKFALWRALAELAPATHARNPEISKHELAPLFLGYYWPLKVKYHVRQGIDPDKDPVVMGLIRRLEEDGKVPPGQALKDFQKKRPDDYRTLLDQVARKAFDDVIPRFHTVRGAPIARPIFTFTGRIGKAGETIKLTEGGRRILIEYKKLVDYVAVSGWVRFTEQFTSAPKLHDKIDGRNLVRGAVARWRESLLKIQGRKCFYNESHDMASPEVDHVLPWSFVLEDKTWNLVLACRKCNNEKRDKLVNEDALGLLCTRNENLSKDQKRTDSKFIRHFTEWRTADLSSHIKRLYSQADEDGFPRWKTH